ncbi:hypothetical protein EV646_101306 [Kribbella antiqua]|uniref:Uncharacterized protein n=1 Tax=Kribbella antiqua TaxID=2512217 RepID=A0A4R2IZJ5_9ACTN|nr:hypothetical protein [Kribbella antiqua]TCO51323.1 hypothetical protein EV646_101306 [Kribbella antiqua]
MNMQGNYPSGELDEMPQEEQARLLVEPTFDHRIDDEADLLRAEFGPPDKDGGYGRGDYEYGGRADS